MGYKIQKHLTVRNKGRRGGNTPQWLVVHYVGATGQAKANADYFHSKYRGSSAHYFIDEGNIVQVVEDNTPAWHVGDGSRTKKGKYNGYVGYGATNFNSIGFELCLDVSTGTSVYNMDFHEGTLRRAEWLIKQKQKQYGIPNSRVIRHYDASGKNCPGNWNHNNWGKWWAFKKRLEGKTVEAPIKRPQNKPTGSIEQKARDTIAGKYGNGEERKRRLGKDYNTVMQRVNAIVQGVSKPKPTKKTVDVIAREVIAGVWGNGKDRENKLRQAGYNPDTVQKEVNRQLGMSKPIKKKSVTVVAKEVIDGKWGNGRDREDRLRKSGYNPGTVQKEVNRQLGGVSKEKRVTRGVVDDVIAGKYGNGKDRENRLKRAGYNPRVVQREVNKRF